MSASEAQVAANRRNALRSTGPRTEEGKARSAGNAVKHGIHAKTAVLFNESQEDYDANIRAFIEKFDPRDFVERRLVERMADCEWRLIRARYVETATLDLQMDETEELVGERFEAIDEPTRLAYAIQLLDPAQISAYNGVQRHESSLHRQYLRDFKLLAEMRKQRQPEAEKIKILGNEPN